MEKLFLSAQNFNTNQLMIRIFLMNILTNYFIMPDIGKKINIPPWIERVLNEMNRPQNYVQGVQVLYDIACRSPEHVCREFKKHLNQTPTEVVNQIRMQEAIQLLLYTNYKIIDICENVGFGNLSHFNHWFKKIYSMSPQEFRNKFIRKD
jgi:AraC family cel operon transcriptional repressor